MFPGMGRPNRAPRGAVRSGILLLLKEKKQNGYSLIQAFAEKSGGEFQPKSGSIYPALNQLTTAGMIEVDENGEYSLTSLGTLTAEKLTPVAEQIFATENRREEPQLHAALRKLLGAFHQLASSGTPEQKEAVAEKLDQLRRDIYQILSE